MSKNCILGESVRDSLSMSVEVFLQCNAPAYHQQHRRRDEADSLSSAPMQHQTWYKFEDLRVSFYFFPLAFFVDLLDKGGGGLQFPPACTMPTMYILPFSQVSLFIFLLVKIFLAVWFFICTW